jgi:hypothetical protein
MRRWPWLTIVVAAVFALSPHGQSVLRDAFYSGEQLSRSISQFLLEVIAAIVAALALIEWVVRTILARRRAKALATVAGNTES